MTAFLIINDGNRRSEVLESEFPFAIGISKSGSILFGVNAEHAPILWARTYQNRIFLQPESNSTAIKHNETPLNDSTWISDGDQIHILETIITVSESEGILTFSVGADEGKDSGPYQDPTPPVSSEMDCNDSGAIPRPVEVFSSPPRFRRGRLARYVAICTFFLLLLSVGFVLVASPVRVNVNPSPVSMAFTGISPSVLIMGRFLALPGTYTLTAEKPGYYKLKRPVTVEFASKPVLNYRMKKLPGLLDVVTRPINGAEVFINNKKIGKTPLRSFEIAAGRHEIRISTERYLPELQKIEIQGMGEKQTVNFRLRPGWGRLIVSSQPDQASVQLNGKNVGVTPLVSDPLQGSYQIQLSKEGWKPASGKVSINAGETVKLPLFRLERIDGMLELKTNPSGATVTVNGQFRGTAPISFPLVSGNKYQLKLAKPGYVPVSRTVHIEGGKTKSMNFHMEPEYGIVFLSTRPAGAKLKVDGRLMGRASRRLKLTTAPHRIEVFKPGYATYSVVVTPRVGVSKRLNVRLKKLTEIQREKAKHGVKTSMGHGLRLILIDKSVRFQVGASRREAGRRSNETLYRVELTRSFMIGEMEVTNREYRNFRARHNSGSEQGSNLNESDQPVVSITWDDAARYLNWLSKKEKLPPAYREENGKMVAISPMTIGYRLPTEAEWVFVARYEGGQRPLDKPLKFVWGNSMPPPYNSGNYADSSASNRLSLVIRGYTDGFAFSAPVGKFPPNKVKVYDLGGNVAEWCHDIYDVYSRSTGNAPRDPLGAKRGRFHVVRGSSWRHGSVTELRLSYRDYSLKPRNDLGFRIARYVKTTPK